MVIILITFDLLSWGQKEIVGKRTTNTDINSTPPEKGKQAFPVGFVDMAFGFPFHLFYPEGGAGAVSG